MVDDNPGDVRLFIEEFKESKIPVSFTVATNGLDALQILYQEGEYIDKPLPDLLIMDIYLPKKSGIEVLSELKKVENLRNIPLVILSASEQTEIFDKCKYFTHIFINKPSDLDEYSKVVLNIEKFINQYLSIK